MQDLWHTIFFWLFSAITIGFGLAVIIRRDPVGSALSLVMTFLGLSLLFFLLDAYFIATIQILVYAGAVMVLFLFIIMLLDLKAERRRRLNPVVHVGGAILAIAFLAQIYFVTRHFAGGDKPFPPLTAKKFDDVHQVGAAIFSHYNLPFQIVGVILLAATIGVVILSKKELK